MSPFGLEVNELPRAQTAGLLRVEVGVRIRFLANWGQLPKFGASNSTRWALAGHVQDSIGAFGTLL